MKLKTQSDIELAKALISPPGDTLAETIDELRFSQTELAARMGRPVKTINELIQGKTAILPDTAIQLENVTGVPAAFWLEREKNYQLELAEIREAEQLIQDKDWLSNFPLKELIGFGWIEVETKETLERMKAILQFFQVASKEAFYQSSCFAMVEKIDYRLTKQVQKNPYALAAWLRQGEIQAREMKVGDFDKKRFGDSIPRIKEIMVAHPADFFIRLSSLAAEAGVKVIHTPKLPNSKVHGATRWVGDTPVIQLSNQFQRNDIFWFTFFHEAGHILKHGKKEVFLEGLEYTEDGQVKEKEADDFAIASTYSEREEAEFMSLRKDGTWTTDQIRDFAQRINTHPAMIVGRLERKEIISRGQGHVHGFYQKIEL
ncbi:helix-turn-helix domain-containing protein [Algoriphagus antarcticus]|uniref:Addiction module HigA family antidote n=1 Tax=Algoriphagus antarcticus TaxID=238540 RepID=A0A3E0DW04_9BACT|nr:helix-turn-helix domain-containing protein [Algoriphagus antarcticus]REG87108.1 addiction module HigA family antidote [Algoriphagus antarcticus]